MSNHPLPRPPRYFPLEKGIYEVAPGLRLLGTDFGNGEADKKIFQIDSEYEIYRKNKLEGRNERLSKYYCSHEFNQEYQTAVCSFLFQRITQEYPDYFLTEKFGNNSKLICTLSNETLVFDQNFNLQNAESPKIYKDAFDALCTQLQEDIAIVSRRDKQDWLSALHLFSPSHWAAEDKIGKDFISVHSPIPHIEKLNKASAGIIEAMIHKGPYVRFVWSFVTDKRLNHHPVAPENYDPIAWKGRSFKNDTPPFYLRIERQVIYGIPQIESSVFGIRVSFISGEEIKNNKTECDLLKSSLLSMSPQSRAYKGVDQCFDQLMNWLG